MTRPTAPGFPASSFPESGRDQKLLGIYQQRQPEFVLQRVRVPGGRLSAAQWRALTSVATEYSGRGFLHLTTRQDIEIHGLAPEAIPALQDELHANGLTTLGAAGDTVRNSTVDPLGGIVPGTWDLFELAKTIERELARLDGAWSLPRKFKISYSGDEQASMRPYLNDIGFVAHEDGTLSAVVAGSLGARPGAGVPYPHRLDADGAVALAVAAVRLHDEHGDRENRAKARLRHVLERVGADEFLDLLGRLFAEESERGRPLAPSPRRASTADAREHIRLSVPRGDVPLGVARQLADALDAAGGEVRVGIEHDLYVFGMKSGSLPATAAAWRDGGRIVACPGTALCSKAAGSTREAADALAPVAAAHPELLFALSGCPNSCSHAAAADVGIVTRDRRDGETKVTVCRILAGGEGGRGPGLAAQAASNIPVTSLAAVVGELLG